MILLKYRVECAIDEARRRSSFLTLKCHTLIQLYKVSCDGNSYFSVEAAQAILAIQKLVKVKKEKEAK